MENIKTEIVSDIMKHTKDYVSSTEKQFRKDPYSYLLNECWEDEIILEPEVIEKQKAEYFEKKREEDYKKKKQEQQKIDDNAADDEWRKDFFDSIKSSLRNKGAR